jgi:hypothetical protein
MRSFWILIEHWSGIQKRNLRKFAQLFPDERPSLHQARFLIGSGCEIA